MECCAEQTRSTMRALCAGLASALGIAIATTSLASAAGPAMSTTWVPTTLDESACVQRAERIVRGAGIDRNLQAIGPTVFGQIGTYTASVRCIPGKGMAMFVVAGPDLETARRHLRQISEKF